MGPYAGYNSNGNASANYNTAVGHYAGYSSSLGTKNTFLGDSSAAASSLTNAMAIGANSYVSASNSLVLGSVSGVNGATSDIKVGIGTTTPAYPLDVQSSINDSYTSYGYLATGGAGTNGSSGTVPVSIRAAGRIVCPEFDAISDARVKHITGLTDNETDLHTIMALRITNYHFIDTIGKSNKQYKKVIAQEVEKVYPDAVSKMTDVVPDIYQLAEIKNGRVTIANTLKAGERVKLITNDKTDIFEVTAADANGFNVNMPGDGKVFVYGREVNDFRAVDYEALTTLNISATQELVKMISDLQKKNDDMSGKMASVIQENSIIREDNIQIKNKLASVNNDIETIKMALQLTSKAQK